MTKVSALFSFLSVFAITAMAYADKLTISTDRISFVPGQVMKITALYKKNDGKPITSPSVREVQIKNPSGSALVKTSMKNVGSGVYTYDYTLSKSATSGKYEVSGKFAYNGVETNAYTYPHVAVATADTTPPLTVVSPASGTYTMPVSVTLAANESATIYYTVNGSTPTTASTRYSAPISLNATTTLKYFARDIAGNNEAVKTATFTAGTITQPPPTGGHASLTYTGGAMCLQCHATQATGMADSTHYRWEGPNSQISNKPGVTGGKLNSAINAYCINTLGNWNGCSGCHIGAGAKPGTVAEATKNIDCLLCHQKGYKRVRNSTTGLFEPDMTKMTINMDTAVQTVHKPLKSNCLQCHAKGGGGDALKRGDLALINGTTSDRNYDVHMATTGANLSCQQCHTFTNHHVAGRGSDLRPTDSSVGVNCSTSTCHSSKASLTSGHATASINNHMKRVACQTCHIPVYGKTAADAVLDAVTGFGNQATETTRTWVTPEWSAANNRWEPTVVKANNLTPVYAFFDGTSWVSDLNDVAVIDPVTGAYKITRPNGGINSANSKLTPFKYKTSQQPRHTASGRLIALDTSVYFKNGDLIGAIQSGLTNMGLNAGDAYTMVKVDEYQMLNHTVTPKAGVLTCAICHGATTVPATQMNLKTMGYSLKAAQSTVCTQCHGNEDMPSFTSLHSKHVTSEKIDCSMCHSFTRAAERGLNVGIKR